MESLQKQAAFTPQQFRLIAYALKELVRENKKYDDFASGILAEKAEELIKELPINNERK
jgi:hypothetical protein